MCILIGKSLQLIRFDEEGSTAAKAAIIGLVGGPERDDT
jgi:hypothetical protein